jgi:DsbC/DsbD-like thiol-disulfide interchange protein
MKRIMSISIMFLCFINAFAQKGDKAQITFRADSVGSNQYALHIMVVPNEGWHIYAQQQPPGAIAQATVVQFTKNPLLKITPGPVKEVGEKETYTDPAAGILQYYYSHRVEFVQGFTRKGKAKTTINGTFTYQLCTNERCLPPATMPFSVGVE